MDAYAVPNNLYDSPRATCVSNALAPVRVEMSEPPSWLAEGMRKAERCASLSPQATRRAPRAGAARDCRQAIDVWPNPLISSLLVRSAEALRTFRRDRAGSLESADRAKPGSASTAACFAGWPSRLFCAGELPLASGDASGASPLPRSFSSTLVTRLRLSGERVRRKIRGKPPPLGEVIVRHLADPLRRDVARIPREVEMVVRVLQPDAERQIIVRGCILHFLREARELLDGFVQVEEKLFRLVLLAAHAWEG